MWAAQTLSGEGEGTVRKEVKVTVRKEGEARSGEGRVHRGTGTGYCQGKERILSGNRERTLSGMREKLCQERERAVSRKKEVKGTAMKEKTALPEEVE